MDQPEKMWYTSRAIWASIVAMLAGVLTLAGINWDLATQAELVKLLTGFAEVGAGVVAWYGRAHAKAPIAPAVLTPGTGMQSSPLVGIVVLLALALMLSACASSLQFAADTFKVDVVSESVVQKARKAALVTFVAWGGAPSDECKAGALPPEQCIGGIQEVIYRYGMLKPCTETASILCRDDGTWAKVKAIELATSHALAATAPAIRADTNDVELLMSLPAVVHDAHAAVTAAINSNAGAPN